jgi:DNA-binding NtrC family response regulator
VASILVADDDIGMREWLTAVLENAGYCVFSAQDGLEARAVASRQALEVVITDISMPNEEGLGLLQYMRRAYPGTKVIVLSGKDPDALDDAVLLGAHAAFQKPVTAQTVLQCLGGMRPR